MPSPQQRKSNANNQRDKVNKVIQDYFKKRNIGDTVSFAAIIGVCVAFQIFCVEFLLHNRVTFLQAVTKSIIIICVTIAFFVIAHVAGGKIVKDELNISPWFTWFIAGSCFVFWIGAFWFGTLYPGGFIAVGVWTIVLICLWSINRITKREKA